MHAVQLVRRHLNRLVRRTTWTGAPTVLVVHARDVLQPDPRCLYRPPVLAVPEVGDGNGVQDPVPLLKCRLSVAQPPDTGIPGVRLGQVSITLIVAEICLPTGALVTATPAPKADRQTPAAASSSSSAAHTTRPNSSSTSSDGYGSADGGISCGCSGRYVESRALAHVGVKSYPSTGGP